MRASHDFSAEFDDDDLIARAGLVRRAPTTLGIPLPGYTFSHVRQLDAVASRMLSGPGASRLRSAARADRPRTGGGVVACR